MRSADVIVIGGGIVGLAFAYAHARRGRKVAIIESSDFAIGASVRNFGLLWPIGQRSGPAHERAMLSREIWTEIIRGAKLWHAPSGSLHLAYADDELAVLEQYAATEPARANGRELLTAQQTLGRSAAVEAANLKGALWSPTEINIDPRQAVRTIPEFLRASHNVTLAYGETALEVSTGAIRTTRGEWRAEEILVCSGADFEHLYPELLAASGMTRCKLQMMRTTPQNGWQLGPSLCAGLTLAHYDCFRDLPALAPLQERFRRDYPFHVEHGIHVLLSQTALGELTIGDSHHYGSTLEPFDRADVNDAIVAYLKTFARIPNPEITERWNGIYPKLSGRTEFVAEPAPGVRIVTGLGGAGMTLSFGLAEEIVSGRFRTAHHGSEKVLV